MRKIKLLVTSLLLWSGVSLFAQSTNVALNKTFEIHSKNKSENLKKYYEAAGKPSPHDVCDLDRYRFYDERRTIEFLGSDAVIVLYSAKELNEKYGKAISPFTIQKGQNYREISFAINLDGIGLKPQFK